MPLRFPSHAKYRATICISRPQPSVHARQKRVRLPRIELGFLRPQRSILTIILQPPRVRTNLVSIYFASCVMALYLGCFAYRCETKACSRVGPPHVRLNRPFCAAGAEFER